MGLPPQAIDDHGAVPAPSTPPKQAGLASAYHHHFDEAQGAESTPTLHWRGAGQRTYHIDYTFIPDAWLPWLREVSVGSKEDWIDSGLSDHVPVVADLADA